MLDFPIKPKPTGNARILSALLSKHGQDKICDHLAVIGWALDKAREQERNKIVKLIKKQSEVLLVMSEVKNLIKII